MAKSLEYATAHGLGGAAWNEDVSQTWTFHETGLLHHFEFSDAFGALAPAAASSAAGTSPGLGSEVAYLSGVTGSDTVTTKDNWNWNNNNPATYSKTSGDAHKWQGGHAGTSGGSVDYYFNPASHWTAGEEKVFKAALTLWSDEANIKFVQTTSAAQADLTFTRGSDGSAYEDGDWTGAAAIGSTTLAKTSSDAEISIDTSTYGFGPINSNIDTAGGYVWGTIVHEEGHMLGLGHGGAYNGDDVPKTQQYSAYDTLQWSTMSYIEPEDTTAKYYKQYAVTGTQWHYNDPTTPMMLDILAVQRLYGAPTTTALSGSQHFGFNCNIGDASEPFFDFTIDKKPVITIWDAGTHNTLDMSGFSSASTINLNPGTFSSCAGLTNNVCIAQDTAINTAIGGDGNDTLIANTNMDRLVGGTGANTYKFISAADSTGASYDTIVRLNANVDIFDVSGKISKIDSAVKTGALSKADFNADLTADIGSHQLGAHHAVEFTPSAGTLKGDHFLIVDLNGHAGYQAGADLVVLLDDATNLGHLSTTNFI